MSFFERSKRAIEQSVFAAMLEVERGGSDIAHRLECLQNIIECLEQRGDRLETLLHMESKESTPGEFKGNLEQSVCRLKEEVRLLNGEVEPEGDEMSRGQVAAAIRSMPAGVVAIVATADEQVFEFLSVFTDACVAGHSVLVVLPWEAPVSVLGIAVMARGGPKRRESSERCRALHPKVLFRVLNGQCEGIDMVVQLGGGVLGGSTEARLARPKPDYTRILGGFVGKFEPREPCSESVQLSDYPFFRQSPENYESQ